MIEAIETNHKFVQSVLLFLRCPIEDPLNSREVGLI